ncbi:hypothetical protein Scep_015873 [Stephania cephalantha]|uniref:Homeobox domain-containing protein n=1 Tax=Stephania cephalantha TaxID=152367 RepID=A0AAP0P0T0_9MAGN
MSVDMDPSMMPMPITESYDPCTTTTTKMRLISLLEEVYRRYKLYYQQTQSIVSSFESVAGLGNAAPYASFALNAMSKHFKSLKNAITDQLHTFTSKPPGNESFNKDESLVYGNSDRWVHCYRTIQSPGIFDHQPVWRPQRGLPERAVAVLRAWLFEHFLHPYPTDSDKQILAKQTGLSRSQVSNWFINARVRLWKPMVEEIHMLETRQAMKSSSDVEDQNSSQPVSDNQVQTNSKHNTEEHSMKRSRNELPSTMPNGSNEPMNFSSYDKLSCQEHVEGGGISIAAGGNSGVSLTLGLRQNNGASLSELLPMNLARSFGVDPSNEGYIIGGFDGSSRQFGKNIGGYMLHDFVG